MRLAVATPGSFAFARSSTLSAPHVYTTVRQRHASTVAPVTTDSSQQTDPGLRMLVFGKPGSGKGTLSARLVENYDLHFISTGDVLRREIIKGSEVGRQAEEVVKAGGLVSDELMLKIIEKELDQLHGKSWILDGFPRTLRQAGLLDSALNSQNRPLNMIVHLRVPDSVILQRISSRWVHLPSGRTYSSQYNKPKVPGRDDVTGEPLTQRPDDTPEVFNKRLEAFYKSTSPLLTYFQDYHKQEYHEIAGSTSDEVRFAQFFRYHSTQGNLSHDSCSSASDMTSTGDRLTAACDTTPDATSDDDPRASNNVQKIWPHLQELVERYHVDLKRRGKKQEVDRVRERADDLKEQEADLATVAKGSDEGKVSVNARL